MKKIFRTQRSDRLLIFATVVASLRFMLVNATAIGIDVSAWPWFETLEVWSGIAFAVLEGVALAYVSKRWRRLHPYNWTEWLYWSILAIGQLILLISITWVTGMSFMAIRAHVLIDTIMSSNMAAWWSMTVAGINPLIVILIGIVEDDDFVNDSARLLPEAIQARAVIEAWWEEYKREPTVGELVGRYRIISGVSLHETKADEYILGWRADNGVRGRRPQLPVNGKERIEAE